jgi:hypothetical protein
MDREEIDGEHYKRIETVFTTGCVGGGTYSAKPAKKTSRLIVAIRRFIETLTDDDDYDD